MYSNTSRPFKRCHFTWTNGKQQRAGKRLVRPFYSHLERWFWCMCSNTSRSFGSCFLCEIADDKMLASGSLDKSIRIWHVDNGECIRTMMGHNSHHFLSLQLLSKNKLASGSSDGVIIIWHWQTGLCVRTLIANSNSVFSLQQLATTNTFVSGSFDGLIKFWNVDSGVCIRTLNISHSGAVRSFQLLDDFQSFHPN